MTHHDTAIGGPGQPADDAIDLHALITAFRRRLGLFIAVAAVITPALVRPRIPSVPKYFRPINLL